MSLLMVKDITPFDPLKWPQGLSSRLCIAAATGLSAHTFIFKQGEWHIQAPYLVAAYISSFPLLLAAERFVFMIGDFFQSSLNAGCTLISFTLALYLSLVVYRIFFHRLKRFPGPRYAAVSKLWHAYHCLGGKNYLFLQELHRKYGDFVRTGPSEITVFTPDVLMKLNGPGNNNLKSAWYDILLPEFGVATIRDRGFHDQRRKFWTSGFSGKEMLVYQERIKKHLWRLETRIARAASRRETVNFKNLSYWFSFDIMGLFAFDRCFDMIERDEWHHALDILRRAFAIVAPVSPVPWLAHIGFTFFKGRWVVRPWHGMIDWCRDRMMERVNEPSDQRDVSAGLVNDFKKDKNSSFGQHLLTGESIVAIVAGSDTVGSATVFLFYELAKHPEQAEKLYAELKTVDVHDCSAVLPLPHLGALINETLRFHHVIPTGGYRDTPQEGLTIGGQYIPKDTTVIAPRYILNRLECAYDKPNEWIPERWTERPEMVKDRRVHLPFALGRYACPGRQLALTEMSMLMALLVSKYHIRFPSGDDGSRVERDMKDQFTALPGQLDLIFEPRQPETEA